MKRKIVLPLAAAVVLLCAGAAYAFWTTSGSGSGSASVSGSGGTVTLHGTISGALAPGGSTTVALTADNAGSSDLQVGTVHLASITPDSSHSTCVVTDFSMPDVVENTTVTHGASGQSLPNSGTLSYANSSSNQDACKGATLTLSLTSD